MRPILLSVVGATMLVAQAPAIREDTFQGRPAWVLENGLIRVSVLSGGGHLAEIRLLSQDPKAAINPMRVPHYPTIDPQRFDDTKHSKLYGTDPHRWLSAGYMGHLLCFPIYGAPSAEEARAGLGNHGEAPIVEWRKIKIESAGDAVALWYGADLPKTKFRVGRAVTLRKGQRQVRVREWIENLAPYDRPINWMQHATFGPPFVEPGKTTLDASATRGQVTAGKTDSNSLKPGSGIQWPNGTGWDGKPVNLRVSQARPKAGTYCALRMDPARQEQFFTLFHPDYHVLIGYVFPAGGNPWLADWQENGSNQFPPWNGKVIARGIEFGSSPFAEGLRQSVQRGSLFDAPAYRWVGGRQRLETEFTAFLVEIPAGYRGAKDARSVNGAVSVTPR